MTDQVAEDTTTQAVRRARALDVMRTLRAGRVEDVQAGVENTERTWGAVGSFACDFAMGEIWARPQLSRRDRSMVVLAALTALGGQPMEVRVHARGALNHGMERQEVEEVLVHLSVYTGFPRAIVALREVQALFQAIDGDVPSPPRAPAARKDDAQRRRDGLDVLRTMYGFTSDASDEAVTAPIEAALGRFASLAVNYVHGEVWSRPQLSRRERSLVTIAAVTVLGREEDLRDQIRGALHHGVTRDEIEEVFGQLLPYAGWPTGRAALRVAREVFGALEKRGDA